MGTDFCKTCVEMTQNAEAMGQDLLLTKRTNKILRTVNGMLRRDINRMSERADEFFIALCETDKQAEIAMGELWGSGEFDCGPQDYDFVVTRCLAALKEYNERRRANPSNDRAD